MAHRRCLGGALAAALLVLQQGPLGSPPRLGVDTVAAQERPSQVLGEALRATGIDPTGLPSAALESRVLDLTVEQAPPRVALAYYELAATSPKGTLHVHVRDEADRAWRSAALDGAKTGAGAITQLLTSGTWTVIDTQVDEATSRTLVLDSGFELTRVLDGTVLTVLHDGILVFQENVEAFAPTRPVIVSTYAPSTGTLGRLHPLPPWSLPRQHFVDRVKRAYSSWGLKSCIAAGHHCNAEQFDGAILSQVRANARETRLAWIQRLGPPGGERNGPVDFSVNVLVTCDREPGGVGGRCRERGFGSYDGPDGANTVEALSVGLSSNVR